MAAPSAPFCLGLDAGGSKTECLAGAPGAIAGRYHGPAANLQRLGPDRAADVLAAVVAEAVAAHPDESVAAVCAGVAGAGRPEDQNALHDALALRLRLAVPDARLTVTHDADVALDGAFDGGSGAIVIAGTGSVVFGRTRDGALERAGGWGYLLGDEGSGHALGLAALRHLAAVFDGAPATPLAARLRDALDLPDGPALIRRVYRDGWPVPNAAPVVCEAAAAGDAAARALLAAQAGLLAGQVAMLAGRLGERIAPRLALLGGLGGAPIYRAAFHSALAAALPAWALVAPQGTAAEGALARAARSVRG